MDVQHQVSRSPPNLVYSLCVSYTGKKNSEVEEAAGHGGTWNQEHASMGNIREILSNCAALNLISSSKADIRSQSSGTFPNILKVIPNTLMWDYVLVGSITPPSTVTVTVQRTYGSTAGVQVLIAFKETWEDVCEKRRNMWLMVMWGCYSLWGGNHDRVSLLIYCHFEENRP